MLSIKKYSFGLRNYSRDKIDINYDLEFNNTLNSSLSLFLFIVFIFYFYNRRRLNSGRIAAKTDKGSILSLLKLLYFKPYI